MTLRGATHNGRCRCGRITLKAAGAPKLVANCHCKSCRKATGASYATFVDYARDAVTIDGPVAIYRSSPGAERLFCSACGSPVAYRGESSPDEINIHIGVFDEPHDFRPSEECNTESRLWLKT